MVCVVAGHRIDRYFLGAVVSLSATGHFIAQRASAVVLLVLGLWFAVAISGLESADHAMALEFVADPINSTLLMVLCAALAYHSYLGVQVVIEDYVHAPRLNWFSSLASRAVHLAIALLLLYTIFEIGFGA